MLWCIYSLTDPRDGRVRYIGKTNNVKVRLRTHVKAAIHHARRNHRLNWIRSLVEAGHKPQLSILEEGDGDWQAAEMKWISAYRLAGHDLVNATDGGEGMRVKFSEESRAKMSSSHKGRIISGETRAKMRAGMIAAWQDPEYRSRMSAIRKGRAHSLVTRDKMSGAHKGKKGHIPSSETRAKMSMARMAISEATRAKMSDSQRMRWASPESRAIQCAAVKAALSSPEARSKLSVTIKDAWARRKAKVEEALQ